MAITFTGLAQQMPYNPDANGDDFVGVDDVLGVLGVYDTALMQSDLSCDYQGTELESLIGDVFAGDLVLDSLYIEYLFFDSVQTYLPGCPDPVTIETVLERSYTIATTNDYLYLSDPNLQGYMNFLGHERNFFLYFDPDGGRYSLEIRDYEIETLTSYYAGSWWNAPDASGTYVPMPFPEDWALTGDGVEVTWNSGGWVANCESFRLIPFWHEAE